MLCRQVVLDDLFDFQKQDLALLVVGSFGRAQVLDCLPLDLADFGRVVVFQRFFAGHGRQVQNRNEVVLVLVNAEIAAHEHFVEHVDGSLLLLRHWRVCGLEAGFFLEFAERASNGFFFWVLASFWKPPLWLVVVRVFKAGPLQLRFQRGIQVEDLVRIVGQDFLFLGKDHLTKHAAEMQDA